MRTAFALGLHRAPELMMIFGDAVLKTRQNLWRSLFVLDRFLATSLGRPSAISEDDCAADALLSPDKVINGDANPGGDVTAGTSGLDAAVRSCQTIGQILKKVYSKKVISTKVAHQVIDDCKQWISKLHPDLHHRHAATPTSPIRGVAILHVNLLYFHSVILLSRPFFLYMFTKVQEGRGPGRAPTRFSQRSEKLCEACVTASVETVKLVHVAFDSHYLAQRNPFIMCVPSQAACALPLLTRIIIFRRYFLFAAILVILSNEFAALYENPDYEYCISQTISLTTYCAETDPQAERLLYILKSFRDVVATQKHRSSFQARPMVLVVASSNAFDPISGLYAAHDHSAYSVGRMSRKNSFVATTSNSPVTHRAPMLPPSGRAKIDGTRNHAGSTSVSPVVAASQPSSIVDGMGGRGGGDPDSADSQGGDAFEFESLWTYWSHSNPAGAGSSQPAPPGGPPSGPGFVERAGLGIGGHHLHEIAGFAVPPSSTADASAAGLSVSVPLFAPPQYSSC